MGLTDGEDLHHQPLSQAEDALCWTVTDVVERSKQAEEAGDDKAALTLCLERVQTGANGSELILQTCRLLTKWGRVEEALELVQQNDHLDEVHTSQVRADAAQRRGLWDEERSFRRRAALADPLNHKSKRQLVQSLIRQGHLSEAEQELVDFEQFSPKPNVSHLRAKLLTARGQPLSAVRLLEHAVDASPERASLLESLLRTLSSLVRHTDSAEARRRAEKRLSKLPPELTTSTAVTTALIDLLISLDRPEEVRAILSEEHWTDRLGEFAQARAWLAHSDRDPENARRIWNEISQKQALPALRPCRPGELRRVDTHPIPPQHRELRLFTMVRDELWRLPWFFDHYRRIGIDRFFVADNGSRDESVQWLLQQPDTHVFHATTTHTESQAGMVWINTMMSEYGRGGWNLYVDADEALVFDRSEARNLRALTSHLEREGHDMAAGPMVDMFSPESQETTHSDLAVGYPFFVPQFSATPDPRCPYVRHTGGIRRLMGRHDWLTKVPLTYGPRSIRYLGSHNVTAGRVNSDLVALLHFKLTDKYQELHLTPGSTDGYRQDMLTRNAALNEFLRTASPADFETADLKRYESSDTLRALDLIRAF